MKSDSKHEKINADIAQSAVIGTFEGECADANITNANGLDITREVWETVFSSDEYKKAIEHGWYIGYLGHPEDPNCMEFEHACIVMTEGHIDDDGKVYGKFNLIDTPVGKIVKTFIDAGVTFGISVRGAGDIIDNSVDPETFVFRGFDIVSFPAFPESIPTFTEIAASSDIETQKKYKAICSAVKNNIDSIDTCEAIDIIQPHFAPQSDEYSMLEKRKQELTEDEVLDISDEKVAGLTELYLDAKKRIAELEAELAAVCQAKVSDNMIASKKLKKVERILSSQVDNLVKEQDVILSSENKYKHKYEVYKKRLDDKISELEHIKSTNLVYKQKINAAEEDAEHSKTIIASLRDDISETVRKNSELESEVSNLGTKLSKAKSQVKACEHIIEEYQDAFGNLYANALGVRIDNISISASTTVEDLKSTINGSANRPLSMDDDAETEEVVDINTYDDADIVTI